MALFSFYYFKLYRFFRPWHSWGEKEVWVLDSDDLSVLEGLQKPHPPTIDQLRHWENNPLPRSRSMVSTEEAFERLINHQFPTSCEGKRFLAWRLGHQGAGSDLHVASWAMAVALATNRIFVS